MAEPAGCCGKIPARADFLVRRLRLDFVEPWHAWLADRMGAARAALGEDWLDLYLYGPIWRFALPAGTIGGEAMLGVLTPSVDKVGRYFPLTVAVPLPAGAPEGLLRPELASWFEAAEALTLRALEDGFDPADLEAELDLLTLPGAASSGGVAGMSAASVLRLDPAAAGSDLAAEEWAAQAQLASGGTVWWTLGAEHVDPALVFAPGLPEPEAYRSFFDGRWASDHWQDRTPPSAGEVGSA